MKPDEIVEWVMLGFLSVVVLCGTAYLVAFTKNEIGKLFKND